VKYNPFHLLDWNAGILPLLNENFGRLKRLLEKGHASDHQPGGSDSISPLTGDLDFGNNSALNLKSAMGVVNVKGFGAKGDGVTDDTEAIQNALDALNSLGGGLLIFPYTASYYKLTDELILYSNVHIVGIGKPRITQTTSGKKIFVGASLTNIIIENLNLYGTGATESCTSGEDGIRLDSCSNIVLRNLLIEEIGGTCGICLCACKNVLITECIIDKFSYAGIAMLDLCEDIWIVGNIVKNCVKTDVPAYGIMSGAETTEQYSHVKRIYYLYNHVENINSWEAYDCHGGEDIYIIGNTAKNIRSGVVVQGAYQNGLSILRNVHIEDNHIECITEEAGSSANAGIIVQGEDDPLYIGEDIFICNNIVKYGNRFLQSNYYGGIRIFAIRNFTIENNYCFQNYCAGIQLYDRCYRFVIRGNKCVDNYGGFATGILLRANIEDGIITNNILKHTGDADHIQEYGFRVVTATSRVLERNNIADVHTSKYGGTIFYMKQEFATTAPTRGNWDRGDIVYQEAPTADNPPGWVCVASGTPGTWKAMANLAT